mgnify:CR=1 FL=1
MKESSNRSTYHFGLTQEGVAIAISNKENTTAVGIVLACEVGWS